MSCTSLSNIASACGYARSGGHETVLTRPGSDICSSVSSALTLRLILVQVHCENADALVDAQARVFASGVTGPEGHYLSRPAVFEVRRTMHGVP